MKARVAIFALICTIGLAVSCGEDGGSAGPNVPPETSIVSLELLEQQHYRAHIVWSGSDPDGRVSHYQVAWEMGHVLLGAEDELDWEDVAVTESTFTLNADLCSKAGTCSSSYTFFVRAVDNGGAVDSSPPHRSFTATTLIPEAWFVYPEPPAANEPTCLRLVMDGSDEDGEVVAFRYCKKLYWDWPGPGETPPDWDSRWSDWFATTDTVLSNMTAADETNPWTFFLQAKDNAGAVQQVFDNQKNILNVVIDPDLNNGPSVTIYCYSGECLGKMGDRIAIRSTSNPGMMDVPVELAEGDTVCFKSSGEEGHFATKLTGVQYTLNSSKPGIYWESPSDSAAWYYPNYGDSFAVPAGQTKLYCHVRDNYCIHGSTAAAYIIIQGNPAPPSLRKAQKQGSGRKSLPFRTH